MSQEIQPRMIVREFGLLEALRVAQRVFDKYKGDQPKWWKRMDGTPILNDVAVRMAEAFITEFRCQFLCGVHAELDKAGKLAPFANCLACIRAENAELREGALREQAPRWIPVEEKLPDGVREHGQFKHKNEYSVLAVDAQGRQSVGYVVYYEDGKHRWTFAKAIGIVTHWMPLPASPGASRAADGGKP